MRALKWILLLISILFFVACGSKNETCETGYHWDSSAGECVKNVGEITDKDNFVVEKDSLDSDAISENDVITESEEIPDQDQYSGDCMFVAPGGTLNINVETRTLVIASLKVDGKDVASLDGELWAENAYTLSDFKLTDFNPSPIAAPFHMPKGSYNFYYKSKSTDNKILIKKDVDLTTDQTISLDIPIFTFSGKVLKNGSAFPSIDSDKETNTKIILSNDSYEFEIKYSDFGNFSVTLPAGKYSVEFVGQLSKGEPVFKGTVMDDDNSIDISKDKTANINIKTAVFSGSVSVEGASVSAGKLAVATQPPVSDVNSVLISDLGATKHFSRELITNPGTSYYVIYLPSENSYPASFLRLGEWSWEAGKEPSGSVSKSVIMDLGKIHGTLSFLGGNFPEAKSCDNSQPYCTRGRLKIIGFDGSATLVKNLGASGGDNKYEILVVRRQKFKDNDGKITYLPKNYKMVFEGHLNDAPGIYKEMPFTIPLKYTNSEGAQATQITFQLADNTFTTDKEINFNVQPNVVSGEITFNDKDVSSKAKITDLIYLKNEDKTEVPVLNLSKIKDKTFSFYVPSGTYDVIYKGDGLLGTTQKVVFEKAFEISSNVSNKKLEIKTSKISLDLKVGDKSLEEFLKSKGISHFDFEVVSDFGAQSFKLPFTKGSGDIKSSVEALNGETWNLNMVLYTNKVGEKESSFTIPIDYLNNLSADRTITKTLDIVSFYANVTVNGKPPLSTATSYRGLFQFGGKEHYVAVIPPNKTDKATLFVIPKEYSTPSPELYLNDGFDTKQKLHTQCVFVANQ